MKKILQIMFLILIILSVGCEKWDSKDIIKKVERVELDKEVLELKVGETGVLVATVIPTDATDKTVTWLTSDRNIAEINQDGEVIARREGEAFITATAGDKSASCKIKVIDVSIVEVEGLDILNSGNIITGKTIGLNKNEALKLTVQIKPESASGTNVTWSSSDYNIAIVDSKGRVTALTEGTATIMATAGGKNASFNVEVKKKTSTKITNVDILNSGNIITGKTIGLNKNEALKLTVQIKPESASGTKVTWSSSNSTIAKVDQNGKVTALSEGMAAIKATAGEKSASFKVKIKKSTSAKITKVDILNSGNIINGKTISLNKNETLKLTVQIKPTTVKNKEVTWSSSNPSVAEVDKNGKVTAKAPGKATITATSKVDNVTGKATIKVNGSTSKIKEVVFKLANANLDFTLKSGILGKGSVVKASSVSADKKTRTYKLANGGYQYTVSGNGYYKYIKSISVDDSEDKITINVNPGKKSGKGWEASTIYAYSNQMKNALAISSSLKSDYKNVFTTPSFKSTKSNHEFSNASDVDNFIKNLDESNDNLYYYSTGGSSLNIPVVVFSKTNLNSCNTLDCSLKKLKSSSKLNILYQAQIHGNEPAPGEAALAMIKSLDSKYGSSLLDKVNVVVVPLYNPIGSKKYERANSNGVDLNRDQLFVSTKEVQAVHSIYNTLLPEVTVDTHEYNIWHINKPEKYADMFLGIAYNLNQPQELNELSKDVLNGLVTNVKAKGLYPDIYLNVASTVRVTASRAYYGLYGSISLLVETPGGANLGKELWEKRVLNQYITVEQYFNYVAKNASEVKKVVTNSRNKIIESGAKYNSNDLLTLEHKLSGKKVVTTSYPVYDLVTGGRKIETRSYGVHDKAVKSRVRPTAYVISKTAHNAKAVVEKLNYNGIKCYTASNGSTYNLMQYSGNGNSAKYGSAKNVKFSSGAYVCTMNQAGANIMAMMLEPDVTDIDGTLVQKGFIKASDIYRSHVNLTSSSASDAINGMKLPTAK